MAKNRGTTKGQTQTNLPDEEASMSVQTSNQSGTEEPTVPETTEDGGTIEGTAESTNADVSAQDTAAKESEEQVGVDVAKEDVSDGSEETIEVEQDAIESVQDVAPEGMGSLAYQLGQYIDAMKPGKAQTGDSLQKNQLKLRSVINAILQLPDEKFSDGMKFLTAVIREHRDGVFNERYVFRGFPQIRVARTERQKLETLITLFLATADSKSPKSVSKNVDMTVVMRFVTNNDQQQKLQSFYGE
jgi:hypothetical protein